ncbi:hypothetical protein [Methylocapsa sp. S129]|uniref:hypothetical protein n=1 Tax=Methylocapsa sp. S129 TaxID=1641869 RepID=UPI00131CEA81|nr:hypothetical protein [Methylocapsa sp. S129]
MRRLLTIVLIALSLFGSDAAFAQGAPAEVVANIYREAVRFEKAKPGLGIFFDAPFRRRYFTASFRAVAQTIDARQEAAKDPTNLIIADGDPIMALDGARNGDLAARAFTGRGLVIKTEREDATRARVIARLGEGRVSVIYAMVKEAGQWRVDDIAVGDDRPKAWSVRGALADDLAAGAKKQ